LAFADPDRLDPGEGEVEVTLVVALEGVTGAVRLKGIEFDSEAAVGPVDIEPVTDLVPAGGRTRQAGANEEGDEAPLELRPRVGGRLVDGERMMQPLRAVMSAVALDHRLELGEVEQSEVFGS
jgi:hypothetical protein